MDKFPHKLTATIIMSEKQEPSGDELNPMLVILNPFIQLTVPFLRTTQNLSVSILTFGLKSSVHKTLEFYIKDKNNDKVLVNSVVKSALPHIAPEISSLNLNLELRNVILENEGEHVACLLVNDELISEYTFYVVINDKKQEI